MDGTLYDGSGVTRDLPSLTVTVHDVTGDNTVPVILRFTKTGGRWKSDEQLTTTINFGNQADGYQYSYQFQKFLFRLKKDSQTFFADASVPGQGESEQFTSNVQVSVELLKYDFVTVYDSVTFSINLNFDLELSNSSSIAIAWDEVPSVHLYENGTLPPEGRPEIVPGGPETNTNTDGTVTNDSDTEQTLTFWGDLDQDGELDKLYELTIPPGQTSPVAMGSDLADQTFGFWTASGNTTGTGLGTQASGEDQTFDLTFTQDQDPVNVKLVLDNGDFLPAPLEIGGGIPQEHITAPPGVTEHEVQINGPPNISGGDIHLEETADDGSKYLYVGIPTGGTAPTVTSTSSGPGGNVSVVTTSGGGSVNFGGAGFTAPPPQSPPTGVTAPTNVSTSSSTDEAAAQLQAIRAEFAAATAGFDTGEQVDEQGIAGILSNITSIGDGVGDLRDEIGADEGRVFFLDPADIQQPNIGKISTYSFEILGQTHTMDFDIPLVNWFRQFVLVVMSIGWFMGMLKWTKI